MIQKEQLLNLADLARIGRGSINDRGVENINSVLGYMENLQSVPHKDIESNFTLINSIRSDDYETVSDKTHELLISNFPEKQDDYNKVQKILAKKK